MASPLPKKLLRTLPTLTEVIDAPSDEPSNGPAADAFLDEDLLALRVIQRVEMVLDEQVRQAISAVVHEQMVTMVPLIRQKVEMAVRDTVSEAVAKERQLKSQSQSQPLPQSSAKDPDSGFIPEP
jgi:hypothetical protein